MSTISALEGTLFPLDRQLEITSETKPLVQTSTIKVYLKLAEDNIFLQGFDEHSHQGRPPTLLRGALVIRILKSTKLKSISLTFKGIARTEWPEGIPPKKNVYEEETMLMNHTWPFYTQSSDRNQSGADMIKSPNSLYPVLSGGSMMIEEVSSLSLDSMSSKPNPLSLLKRVASPTNERKRSNSIKSSMSNETVSEHYNFEPGDYIYNFEHPIQPSTPESIDASFGYVHYHLEVFIERQGAFKSNINARLPVRLIRAQADESIEDSEPIAISRDWEDQLHYDILIASKAIILNAYLPIYFKLVPLDKIKLHRIRIYLTENLEYYCRNKKVHRMEPVRKYLLLEHKAPPPKDLPKDADPKLKKMGNLLTSDGYDLTAKEFEFQLYVPQKLNNQQRLHPNTSYGNIKSHHWIKICLRLSRQLDGKPKHYEISIDSPIHVLDPMCSHANTLLPAYGAPHFDSTQHNHHESNIYFPMEVLDSPPLSPEVEAIDSTPRSIYTALGQNNRSRSSSTLNHSLPNFESTLSANIYKPEELNPGLTSPQAVPLSPMLSPMLSIVSAPSDDIPPPFEEVDFAPLSPVIPSGIDAIMDSASPPRDPPSYLEIMKNERHSPIFDPAPRIELTRASTTDNNDTGDPNDLAESFQFGGASPIMPSAVMRATSSNAQMIRASVRSAASTPRASFELHHQDIDSVLHDDQVSRLSSSSSANSPVPYIDEDIADMVPLLQQTTVGSLRPSMDMSRLQSVESFGRRESATVDITGLYQSHAGMFASSLELLPMQQDQPQIFGRRRSSVNPVMSILNDGNTASSTVDENRIVEENESTSSLNETTANLIFSKNSLVPNRNREPTERVK
jgi:hypothetical protein